MKKIFFVSLISLLLVTASCKKSKDAVEENQQKTALITLTTTHTLNTQLDFSLGITEPISVDWGDGKQVTYKKQSPWMELLSGTIKSNTIKVFAPKAEAITDVWMTDIQLSRIDISSATALISLTTKNNNLTSLDISKNSALRFLNIINNNIKTTEMDKVLNNLPNRAGKEEGIIIIRDRFLSNDKNEDGSASAKTAAKQHNWTLRYEED